LRLETLVSLTSIAVVGYFAAMQTAVERPTYPTPTMATLKLGGGSVLPLHIDSLRMIDVYVMLLVRGNRVVAASARNQQNACLAYPLRTVIDPFIQPGCHMQ